MTNELTRPLTDAEEGLGQEKLAALLVRQIARRVSAHFSRATLRTSWRTGSIARSGTLR